MHQLKTLHVHLNNKQLYYLWNGVVMLSNLV